MADEPDPQWLAEVIGSALAKHEDYEECTCSEEYGGECWYRLSQGECNTERGHHVLHVLRMNDMKVVRNDG